MQIAVDDLIQARWTDDIHEEWIGALLRNEPNRNREKLERTRELMNRQTRDSLVTGYEAIIPTLELPDPEDRHVLAAAITGDCETIIGWNLKHFPAEVLASFGIVAEDPDTFLAGQLSITPEAICSALQKIRGRLKNPKMDQGEYLSNLRRVGLEKFVNGIESIKAQV